ncbi:MAG: DUF559 domain-containing protein [Actinomycetota bacterium]
MEVDRALASLAERQHGLVSRRQALAMGTSASGWQRRVKAGLWLPAGPPAVYRHASSSPSWQQRVMAAVLSGPPATVASHRSAAALHGIWAPDHVEATMPRRAGSRGGAAFHREELDQVDVTAVAGVPVTAVERTLVDLAAVVGDSGVERAAEAAFRLGLTTSERVARRLEELAGPGRTGVRRLRRVLGHRHRGRPAGSELEVRAIQLLWAAGLDTLVRQFEVIIGGNRYLIDLADPVRRVAIELDGFASHSDAIAFQRDRARQNALVLAGWTVLRFTWADVVHRPGQVVAAVAAALAA